MAFPRYPSGKRAIGKPANLASLTMMHMVLGWLLFKMQIKSPGLH